MPKNYIVSNYFSDLIQKNYKDCHFHSFSSMQSNGIKDCLKWFEDKHRESPQSIISKWNYTTAKNQLLSKIISERLSKYYGYKYSTQFWSYLYSLNLLKYITIIYNFYSIIQENFKSNDFIVHEINLREIKNLNNFESTTDFLKVDDIGQEFLLTIFFLTFIKKQNSDLNFSEDYNNSKAISLKDILERTKKFLSQKSFDHNQIKVGILGSFFDPARLITLFERSQYKIGELSLPSPAKNSSRSSQLRSMIFADFDNMDEFDKFFLECSKYVFPTDLIEGLDSKIKIYGIYLDKLKNLEYIVTEAWLGSTDINVFRALASEKRGVKTLYNEHNCFFHPYLGDLVNLQASLVDQYLTMGWKNNDSKFLSTSSLFAFRFKKKTTIKHKFLYVSYPIIESKNFYTSLYSNSDYSGYIHLLYVKNFFSFLDDQAFEYISYRAYPKDYNVKIAILDKEYFLNDYIKKMNVVSSYKFSGPSCKEQIASSELVIIDRPSTAYLESLHMNVPTICFFDPTTMFLKEEYAHFFDDLIDAKIIHTNPRSAADHFNKIRNDIDEWWLSDHVQKLKDRWLNFNFGHEDDLTNYLLKICGDKD